MMYFVANSFPMYMQWLVAGLKTRKEKAKTRIIPKESCKK